MPLLNEILDYNFYSKSSYFNDNSFPFASYEADFEPDFKIGDIVFIDSSVTTRINSIWGKDDLFEKMFGSLYQYVNCPGRIKKITKKATKKRNKDLGRNIWTITIEFDGENIDVKNVLILKKQNQND